MRAWWSRCRHRPIEGASPTETTVAHVVVGKYADHLPLYLQAQIYARQGINLDCSTLVDQDGAVLSLTRDCRPWDGRARSAGYLSRRSAFPMLPQPIEATYQRRHEAANVCSRAPSLIFLMVKL